MEIKNVPVRGYSKTRIGIVTSDKMDKTVVVAVKTKVRHPLYGKMVTVPSKSRRTMRKILAVSAIPLRSWRPARFPRISVGVLSKLLKRLSKPEGGKHDSTANKVKSCR